MDEEGETEREAPMKRQREKGEWERTDTVFKRCMHIVQKNSMTMTIIYKHILILILILVYMDSLHTIATATEIHTVCSYTHSYTICTN